MDVDAQKRAAAARALEFVRPGMRLGLGSGSTAKHFVELLAERVRTGLDVIGVPTSEATRSDAERLGVPLTNLDETPQLDLTVDGADEIAHDLSVIKGGGGALLHEKIVASASARMIVIADESKWVSALGRFPLPVEVVPSARQGWPRFRHGQQALGSRCRIRADRRSEIARRTSRRYYRRGRARLVHWARARGRACRLERRTRRRAALSPYRPKRRS